jgi:hypothetical protein
MDTQDLGSLLERIGAIREACDLDLLLFFHRHPRALLTGEQLVSYLGYDRERIEDSIERLIEAGLLTRSQNPARAARLYVLELGGVPGKLLSSLARIAATREGRQEAMRRLQFPPDRARSRPSALSPITN